jgi:hypothetical protein
MASSAFPGDADIRELQYIPYHFDDALQGLEGAAIRHPSSEARPLGHFPLPTMRYTTSPKVEVRSDDVATGAVGDGVGGRGKLVFRRRHWRRASHCRRGGLQPWPPPPPPPCTMVPRSSPSLKLAEGYERQSQVPPKSCRSLHRKCEARGASVCRSWAAARRGGANSFGKPIPPTPFPSHPLRRVHLRTLAARPWLLC